MYSKNGSIPKPETDGTEGWIEVPEAPECPEGKEVIWWYPPGWVIRDPKPEGNWSWSQSEKRWVEYTVQTDQIPALTTDQILTLDSSEITSLSSQDISSL
jgi:hypothetical protein